MVNALAEAKSAVLSLRTIPYQRRWVEALQQLELKREVAGTSRIEGADLTERELQIAMSPSPEQLMTRSQRQAHAAVRTYRWIAQIPNDRPIDDGLIREIHRHIVTGADDDHCPPGVLRAADQNVTFGNPRHRGVEGGEACDRLFREFTQALQREYRDHDPLVQAIAAHYHLAALHPFLDGNGRTARALEALLLQRAGLRDTSFIAMSNYYYDEKAAYLAALADARRLEHDLTPFLAFSLRGVALQCRRLLAEIQHELSRELFKNLMYDLFGRLKTPRKRVIAERQIQILQLLLAAEWVDLTELIEKLGDKYASLKSARKAIVRDLNHLIQLRAVDFRRVQEEVFQFRVRLEWPSEITESAFFEKVKQLPRSKTHSFLR